MDILDMILGAEMANEYTDSQRLGYKETKTITWDGNTEGKEILPIPDENNNVFYLVSNEPADLNNVKKLSWFIESSHIEESIDLSYIVVASEEPLHFIANNDGIPYVIVCDTDFETEGVAIKKGTYFLKGTVDPFTYVNYIEVETIHQIDQKFIPNTVINLCDYGINAYEILQTAVATGAMYGSFTIDHDDGKSFGEMIPRDGSPITFLNNDGVNQPIFHYGATIIPGSMGGVVTLNIKLINGDLGKIVNLFLHMSGGRRLNPDGTVICPTTTVSYIIDLQNNPT